MTTTTFPVSASASISPLLKPLNKADFGFQQASHLLNRAGFGGTPAQIRMLAEWGVDRSVDHLINFTRTTPAPVPKGQFDSTIMEPLTAEERALYRKAREAQREDIVEQFRQRRQQRQRADRKQIRDMQKWWMTRLIETSRPLEEKMTLFYHGHFATGYRKIENSFHLFQQNQLFRKYALGNFGDLTFRIIRDPAMIVYLDNNRSRKQAPNENLARELMELFTLGEGVVYRENDIKQGARALTGYTFIGNKFIFNREQHDDALKTIFGKTGNFNGDDFVKLILSRPECSEFIAWKLYRFFVNDLPDTPDKKQIAVIKALAQTIRKNHYEIAPVLDTLFRSKHFYDEVNTSAQIKSPIQLVVQGIRSLNTPVTDVNILIEACGIMGQTIFEPPNVKGWEGGRSWINTSTLYIRQNILTYLITGRTPYGYQTPETSREFDPMHLLKTDPAQLSPDTPDTPGKIVDHLTEIIFARMISDDRKQPLIGFLKDKNSTINKSTLAELLCLITAMPEYQLC